MTAVEKLKRWRSDPVYFVQDQFGVNPDPWQADALRLFADPKPKRKIALSACAGVGKSSVSVLLLRAWLPPQGRCDV